MKNHALTTPVSEALPYTAEARSLVNVTPLAMMLRGMTPATNGPLATHRAAEQLQEAALQHARAVTHLSHRLAAIWLEPMPVGPISAVTKVSQTQAALIRFLVETSSENVARFETLTNTASSLIASARD